MMLRFRGGNVVRGMQQKQGMWCHSSARTSKISRQNVQEVQIPVPWGYVAGKWWGDSSVQPVIGLHGWEDNANTFATLAPLLNARSFLAIDFMGHGLSSRFPAVGAYHFLDFVILLRRIADHFKWNKLSLIGHSFGSVVAFVYSALFPDDVDAYVSIDCVRVLIMKQKDILLDAIRYSLDRTLAIEKRLASDPPSYTYEELRKLVHTGSIITHHSDFLSVSTDTTTDITDVTPCPSSSGCSSMSRPEAGRHSFNMSHKDAERKQQKSDKPAEDSSGLSMKLLVNALVSFDRQKRKSVTSNISSNQKNRLGRKNMSFSNEQHWKIERENRILLRKLEHLRKAHPKQSSLTMSQSRLPSSALNRRKQQAKIDHDNMILLKKIEQTKPSVHTAVGIVRR